MFLLVCILGTSFIPCYADNNVSNNTKSETSLNQDASSLSAPRRKKSKKRRSRRGGGGSDISFEQGKIEVDAGVGFPLFSLFPGVSTKVLPISAAGEYCFWSGEKSSWGVGLVGSYQSFSFKSTDLESDMNIPNYNLKSTTSDSVGADINTYFIGPKITWHYNFNSNIEFYWSLYAGYFGMNVKGNSSDFNFNYNGPLPLSMMGFRFFFSDNIGMFIECGFDGAKAIGGGLSLKF